MNVLVIKLGALGDVVLAFPAMADIRAHHPEDRITLLTTGPFASLLGRAPWFDEVRVDRRPAAWNVPGMLAVRRQLRGFDLVYDLQTSGRTSWYFRLAGRPAWSGIARDASLPHANPERDALHTVERQREQLAMAGVPTGAYPDLAWLTRGAPAMWGSYAMLVPGAAAHRPGKRWPAERFGELATRLLDAGLHPVVAGTVAEAPLAAAVLQACPAATDMTGRTDLRGLAGLAADAALAVGNDTGPMHLAAALGTPSLVLFGPDSDPALTAPRGPREDVVTVLRVPDLADLPVERVAAALPKPHTRRPFTETH